MAAQPYLGDFTPKRLAFQLPVHQHRHLPAKGYLICALTRLAKSPQGGIPNGRGLAFVSSPRDILAGTYDSAHSRHSYQAALFP